MTNHSQYSPQEAKLKLKEADIKCTDGAILVLQTLSEFHDPIAIEQLEQKIGNQIHLATIYRILEKFEQKNLVNKLKFNEQKSFYELNKLPHNHFVCTNCHKVLDIYIDDSRLNSAKKSVGENYNVNVKSASINFTGVCKDC